MALHFDPSEFAARRAALARELGARGLDGLLVFAQESMYWLTGYDTFGYCFFQCLHVDADGNTALITRSADLRQARATSDIADIRVWTDDGAATPGIALRDMLEGLGKRGARLGIELDTHGLTAANWRLVEAAMEGFCTLEDASQIVPRLRAVKSPAEIAHVRRAAALADQVLEAAHETIAPGADEGAILAAMQGAVFAGGGDYAGNEFIIGSGADALLCRHKSGRRKLSANDQITIEFAGVHRHYHVAMMRTVLVGEAGPAHRAMHEAACAGLAAVEDALRPGATAGEAFDAHARALDAAGYAAHRLNACGYSLGARFTPSWMDSPMMFHGNDWVLERNMVMFAHMILMNSDDGRAMCLGQTYLLGDGAPEPLSSASLELVTR